ncbi:MAG: thiamine ABC transporter substrate-binding protein [Ilumatobacteraceae bacterium]
MATLLAVAVVGPLIACGDDGDDGGDITDSGTGDVSVAATPSSLTMVVYDSFPESGSLTDALAWFTADTGIAVDVVVAGDTGTMVSKAVLTAGNPEGDVMFGVDNTFLSRILEAEVFEDYAAAGLETVPDALTTLVPDGEATPVDFGDVCVNYDVTWFEDHDLEPPGDLEALADPAYAGLLVVENPASSSPGLAFVLASIASFGEDGWRDYWTRLRDNGVEVVDGWTEAYYEQFSGASDGEKPLVVSYGTSPPAEVVFADPPIDEATTAVIDTTCFRQVEFAGVLRGTDHPTEARQLVDFLLTPTFQAELPLNLFVYPANGDVALPEVFTANASLPADPATLDPATIAAGREGWIEQWTDTVLR